MWPLCRDDSPTRRVIKDGSTFDQVKALWPAGNFRALAEFSGGFNGVRPGERRRVILDLGPGAWALWSRPSAAVPPPGVLKPLTTAATAAAAPEPIAEVSVSGRCGRPYVTSVRMSPIRPYRSTSAGHRPDVLRLLRRGRARRGRVPEVRAVGYLRAQMPRSWRAAIAWLERMYPERWRRTERHEVTGAAGGPIEVDSDARRRLSERADAIVERLAADYGRDRPKPDAP